MKIKIRKAKISDLGSIAELEKYQNLLHEKFDYQYYAADKNFKKKWIKLARKKLINNKKHLLLVAVNGNTIVGFIHGDIRDNFLRRIKKYGHIDDIFIDEHYRDKKIGTMLANKLMQWFKREGILYVDLMLSSKNKAAAGFYGRLGFKEYERMMKRDI